MSVVIYHLDELYYEEDAFSVILLVLSFQVTLLQTLYPLYTISQNSSVKKYTLFKREFEGHLGG